MDGVLEEVLEEGARFNEMLQELISELFKGGFFPLQSLPIIGRGPSGVVRVWSEPAGTKIALKVLPINLHDKITDAVLLELRQLYSNCHKNIVLFYGANYFLEHNSIVIATEYADCLSLHDILKERGAVPENVLAAICGQIIEGLSYLHKIREPHVIHRDVKPTNILVQSSGVVKLNDFGLSAMLPSTMAAATTYVGLETYMSPERIVGLKYTNTSDVWSVGVVTVVCGTGKFPYSAALVSSDNAAADMSELLDLIVDGPVPALPRPPFSEAASDFVAKCCERDCEKRSTAMELKPHPFIRDFDVADIARWLQSRDREESQSKRNRKK